MSRESIATHWHLEFFWKKKTLGLSKTDLIPSELFSAHPEIQP